LDFLEERIPEFSKLLCLQVILQGNQKQISALTMQQLQMLKQGQLTTGGGAPILTHAVVTKNVSGSVQRVIPVTPATSNPQLKQQTFQVVAASPGQQIAGRAGNQVSNNII
jgi:hypothetical protein